MGKIQAICSSDVRGIAKSVIPEGRFKVDWGLEGDAHAGHWHRQVSLLGLESIEDFRRAAATWNLEPLAKIWSLTALSFQNFR